MGIKEVGDVHPGHFLQSQLEANHMSQHDLAVRTGVSDKHISTIINGTKNISASFAKKLEYALDIKATVWMEKQAVFDVAMTAYEEANGITDEEFAILKKLKEVVKYYQELDWIHAADADAEKVVKMRKLMGVSSLTAIPYISYDAAYRAQIRKNTTADPFVLYAWQRTCELLTEKMAVSSRLDTDLLKSRLFQIKELMFLDMNEIREKLTKIFAECGIAFRIVRNFVGAPVQGFIKKTETGHVILCVTFRGKRADSFWFTLFHEIGHILNGDFNTRFVDVRDITGSEIEQKADEFARNCLLDEREYLSFVMSRDFSLDSIKSFAEKQHVRPYVVIGRLHRDELLEWRTHDQEIERYDWASA